MKIVQVSYISRNFYPFPKKLCLYSKMFFTSKSLLMITSYYRYISSIRFRHEKGYIIL